MIPWTKEEYTLWTKMFIWHSSSKLLTRNCSHLYTRGANHLTPIASMSCLMIIIHYPLIIEMLLPQTIRMASEYVYRNLGDNLLDYHSQ